MTKSELVDQVADRADMTKQDATRAVDAVLATVEDALRRGSEVTVSGFGKFHVSERGARMGVNPRTGERIQIAGLARASLHRRERAEERGEGSLNRAGSFAGKLAAQVAARESQIVLGIDPDPSALWPASARASSGVEVAEELHETAAGAAAAAVLAHCVALIDATAPACVAVKLQLARFELLGASGRRALEAVIAHARAAGLLVIADGKRGDIDVTAQAYAAGCSAAPTRRSDTSRGSARTS